MKKGMHFVLGAFLAAMIIGLFAGSANAQTPTSGYTPVVSQPPLPPVYTKTVTTVEETKTADGTKKVTTVEHGDTEKGAKHEEKLADIDAKAKNPCLKNFFTRPLACDGPAYPYFGGGFGSYYYQPVMSPQPVAILPNGGTLWTNTQPITGTGGATYRGYQDPVVRR